MRLNTATNRITIILEQITLSVLTQALQQNNSWGWIKLQKYDGGNDA